jgi:hypothetical protein
MDTTCHPPELSSFDMNELAILMANMMDSFLQQNNLHETNKYAQQNSILSQRKISLCLPEAINHGTSALNSQLYLYDLDAFTEKW